MDASTRSTTAAGAGAAGAAAIAAAPAAAGFCSGKISRSVDLDSYVEASREEMKATYIVQDSDLRVRV